MNTNKSGTSRRLTRRAAAPLTIALALALSAAACGQGPSEASDLAGAEGTPPTFAPGHILKPRAIGATIVPNASGLQAVYQGGPVLQRPKVVAVYWNASVYGQSLLDSFYPTILGSSYVDWLLEYDTTSPSQIIGHGTFGGGIVDPQPPAGSSISDADIQHELARMIDAGQLPANAPNNLYMVHFPPGITVTDADGLQSCKDFCAYHYTFAKNGANVYYGVVPDLGCLNQGCSPNNNAPEDLTEITSHELIEAVTDPAVGLNQYGWLMNSNAEIADVCETVKATTVDGFSVQTGWSNLAGGCIAGPRGGGANGVAAPGDFDGDGKADLSVKSSVTGTWYIDYASNGYGSWDEQHGGYGGASTPTVADYDHDGKADLSVKDSGGTWYIDYARNGFGGWDEIHGGYGGATAIPVPADYDNDGKADLSERDGTGTWYIDYARNGFGAWDEQHAGYGTTGSAVPADYDGDGKADLSVKDSGGTWYIDYARNGFGGWDEHHAGYGDASAVPAPADYDGDRKADLSTKDATGTWHIDYARNGFGSWDEQHAAYGGLSSTPTPADYDGDHHADLSTKDTSGGYDVDYAADGFGAWNVTVDVSVP